jgi:uncharacterized membrane protein
MSPAVARGRIIARFVLAAAYFTAGIAHLWAPKYFHLIMPDWVLFPHTVILATGAAELAGAIGLITPNLRRAAGIGLALYAICVFPANIKHALYGIPGAQVQLDWWYHGPRLVLQPVLVWLALFVGEVIDWPFRRRTTDFYNQNERTPARPAPLP